MCFLICFFFKQKTAYEMRMSDWSSDVCSSDLRENGHGRCTLGKPIYPHRSAGALRSADHAQQAGKAQRDENDLRIELFRALEAADIDDGVRVIIIRGAGKCFSSRSEEHTSELQSLMRISYAVFCLKKKKYRI